MHRLLYIVLFGGLVFVSVYAEVDSARESLERSSFSDQSQTDDNEKVIATQNLATIESFSRSPVNVRSLQTGRVRLPPIDSGGQVSNGTGENAESKHSEEHDDLSSEGHDPLPVNTHMVSLVNRSEGVDPAPQVVNKTASNGEIKARIRSGDQGQRTRANNRLLQNRLNRGKTTTTASPISGHSDEKGDDSDKKTTTARNVPARNRMNGFRTTARSSIPSTNDSGEEDDPVKQIGTTTVKPIQTTTIRNAISRNGFGRFRTTTESAPLSTDSDEDSALTNQTVTTTARTTSSNRFSRVRTTTVPTSDNSAEEVESASVVPTTARSLAFGNLFGRFRTTTPMSRDSNENDGAVKELQTTTVRNSLSKNRINRFQTTSSKSVSQESQEQVNVITTTQTPVLRKSLSGNRFNRIQTTTTVVPISDTSDEVDEAIVNQTTTSRTLISGNRLSRFRTTTSASVSKKESEEQDESFSTTTITTTTRTLAFRNRLNAIRTTTSPTISRDSIEEEDTAKKTSTTTERNSLSRFRFGLTRTAIVPTATSSNSDEVNDVANKTETTTTRRFLAGNRFGVLRKTTATPVSTTSLNSDEDDDSTNANQTTTTASSMSGNRFKGFRITTCTPVSKDSEEQVTPIKKTQTTIRNSLLRNRPSRLQATTTSSPIVGNVTEQVNSGNGTQASNNTSNHTAVSVTISSHSDDIKDTNNTTETTTARTRVTLKYFNRYRTTTDHKLISENSDRSVSTTQMTSNVQIPSTTGRSSSTPPGKTTSSPETANLGRKDRAIIYNTKTNIDVNHLNDFQTEAPVPAHTYFTARHSDETDDVSEDEDISSLPYPNVQYRITTVVPFTTMLDEDNSDEGDELSLESHDTVTDKPENSDELSKDDMITMMVPNAANIFMAKKSVDSSVEIIYFVSNNSESIRNQTATLLRSAKLLMDSDEGNDASAEGEGSGAIPNDDVPRTTSLHQYARITESDERNDASTEIQMSSKIPHLDVQNPNDSLEQDVYGSEERGNTSTETEVSNRLLTGGVKVQNQTESEEEDVHSVTESNEANTVSAESVVNEGTGDIRPDRNKTSAEVPQDSDENDESSLEVDVSKLPEIKKLLSDAENERTSPDVEDRAAAASSETRAVFPDIDSLMKVDVNHHMTSPAAILNETMLEDANKKNEVNMKIRELLTNPIVQERLHERLQAIDGRLKDSKSARVKRLIEKYLAALAKLSPSSNSANSVSFSVFFPLIITCLLFGFS